MAFVLSTGCARGATEALPTQTPFTVITTIYPLQFFAGEVAGDRATILSLVPAGADPHDWEPTAADIRTVQKAQLLLYNGAGLEPWLEPILSGADHPALAAVDTGEGLALHSGDAADFTAAGIDPHIWLDPIYARHQVRRVAAALAKMDPDGAQGYENRAAALIGQLEQLDGEYRRLDRCRHREVVITHAFFGYPARRYGLSQIPILSGFAPESEPTPRQMARLITHLHESQIRYILVEPPINNRIAQTISNETGARPLAFYSLETLPPAELAAGHNYLTLTAQNLINLKTALECET